VDRPEKLNEFQEGLIRAAKQLEKERPKGQANPLPRRP
jgi:hypothetical protein